ncbi:MAG: RNA polymerase sigma factor [Planctomycetales bacterium]|nr:RNA polymerase sigma factor [Planctomycetales bacterium]
MTEQSDELAFLVREHQATVWRYLRFLGCEANEADDLTQETFVVLFQSAEADRTSTQTAAFLRGIARNRLLMLRRRQGHEPSTVEWDLAEQVWTQATADGHWQDSLDALADCLETAVQPRVRRAIDMHYTDRASREEIARELELSPEGVKTMLRRARSALRECVERKVER